MKLAIPQAIEFGKHLLIAQDVPEDIAFDVAEHLVRADQVGYPATACLSCRRTIACYHKALFKPTPAPN